MHLFNLRGNNMNDIIYKRFADVAVKVGVNLQPGQDVSIYISTRQREFAKYLVEASYKAGARNVNVEWNDEEILYLKYKYGDEQYLSRLEDWEEEKQKLNVKNLPCRIFVDDDNPNAFDGLDMGKIMRIGKNRRSKLKKYRDMIDGKDQWLIISVPSVNWAKLVFPHDSQEKALKKLWDLIIKTTRIDTPNYLEVWQKHVSSLKSKARMLNDLDLKKLNYKSSNGTNLEIYLNPMHLWQAASEYNQSNIEFVANMPTEEVFTMPKRDGVNGVVYSTKPLSYNGSLIEDFVIWFENGKAVKYTAKKGYDVLKDMLETDESASYLGEVALVPYDSPINQTKTLFYNTLFDENACCHLAFGQAFKDNLRGYLTMTEEEVESSGMNKSLIHVDFMIGAPDLEIKGYDHDDKEYIIFKNGVWNI